MAQHALSPLAHSARPAPTGQRLGDVDDAQPVRLTVVFKPGAAIDPTETVSREEFRRRYASNAAAVNALVAYAKEHGLTVELADAGQHQVRLSGTYGQARAAFQPQKLGRYRHAGREFVGREGHLSVPTSIAGEVVAVMGFDTRPIAHTHYRRHKKTAASSSYNPAAVAQRYGFPAGLTGAGQVVALIELGGGYEASQQAAYFKQMGIDRTGTLSAILVDGATNTPDDPNGADGEVQLDIQVAGSIAPAADIAVYFGTQAANGFLDAITTAIHDTTREVSVMSISWGGPESSYAAQDLEAMDQAFQSAGALGIPVCVASGDSGADDGTSKKAVDFPASSPNVLGCGGTRLPASGAEVAWNDGSAGGATGGGYSAHFTRPSWQTGNTNSHRGVPDVAGDADPETGYNISVDGTAEVVGGTSAVAPLWAALLALTGQQAARRLGLVNPTLYANQGVLTDITSGNNAGYKAAKGWDPVTGLGSPKGEQVVTLLSGANS